MQPHSKQTFFLPDRYSSQQSTLRSDTYNLAHTLLNRTASGHVFVPIRSLQYLAVIDGNDIYFVDSLAYAVNDNEGGRMITISWHPSVTIERESLKQNIAMSIIFYAHDMTNIQSRLYHEFHQAMKQLDQRYRDQKIPAEGARIIALKPEG
jgi:hypothetical protein